MLNNLWKDPLRMWYTHTSHFYCFQSASSKIQLATMCWGQQNLSLSSEMFVSWTIHATSYDMGCAKSACRNMTSASSFLNLSLLNILSIGGTNAQTFFSKGETWSHFWSLISLCFPHPSYFISYIYFSSMSLPLCHCYEWSICLPSKFKHQDFNLTLMVLGGRASESD